MPKTLDSTKYALGRFSNQDYDKAQLKKYYKSRVIDKLIDEGVEKFDTSHLVGDSVSIKKIATTYSGSELTGATIEDSLGNKIVATIEKEEPSEMVMIVHSNNIFVSEDSGNSFTSKWAKFTASFGTSWQPVKVCTDGTYFYVLCTNLYYWYVYKTENGDSWESCGEIMEVGDTDVTINYTDFVYTTRVTGASGVFICKFFDENLITSYVKASLDCVEWNAVSLSTNIRLITEDVVIERYDDIESEYSIDVYLYKCSITSTGISLLYDKTILDGMTEMIFSNNVYHVAYSFSSSGELSDIYLYVCNENFVPRGLIHILSDGSWKNIPVKYINDISAVVSLAYVTGSVNSFVLSGILNNGKNMLLDILNQTIYGYYSSTIKLKGNNGIGYEDSGKYSYYINKLYVSDLNLEYSEIAYDRSSNAGLGNDFAIKKITAESSTDYTDETSDTPRGYQWVDQR